MTTKKEIALFELASIGSAIESTANASDVDAQWRTKRIVSLIARAQECIGDAIEKKPGLRPLEKVTPISQATPKRRKIPKKYYKSTDKGPFFRSGTSGTWFQKSRFYKFFEDVKAHRKKAGFDFSDAEMNNIRLRAHKKEPIATIEGVYLACLAHGILAVDSDIYEYLTYGDYMNKKAS